GRLPRRWDLDFLTIEGEPLRVLHEVKQVRVAPIELSGAVDSECVVPDHPTAARESELLLENQLQLSRVFIADRQPKSAVRLQDALDRPAPTSRPLEIVIGVTAVVVVIVFVANIKGGIGKDEIDELGGASCQAFDAVSLVDAIEVHAENFKQLKLRQPQP